MAKPPEITCSHVVQLCVVYRIYIAWLWGPDPTALASLFKSGAAGGEPEPGIANHLALALLARSITVHTMYLWDATRLTV